MADRIRDYQSFIELGMNINFLILLFKFLENNRSKRIELKEFIFILN